MSQTTALTFTKSHPYGGRRRRVGEILTVPRRDAIILKALRVAQDAPAVTSLPTPLPTPTPVSRAPVFTPFPATPDEAPGTDEPKKRSHKRRDPDAEA